MTTRKRRTARRRRTRRKKKWRRRKKKFCHKKSESLPNTSYPPALPLIREVRIISAVKIWQSA